jgi:hypothetical protein
VKDRAPLDPELIRQVRVGLRVFLGQGPKGRLDAARIEQVWHDVIPFVIRRVTGSPPLTRLRSFTFGTAPDILVTDGVQSRRDDPVESYRHGQVTSRIEGDIFGENLSAVSFRTA